MFRISYKEPIFVVDQDGREAEIKAIKGETVSIKYFDGGPIEKYHLSCFDPAKEDPMFALMEGEVSTEVTTTFERIIHLYHTAHSGALSFADDNADISYKSGFNLGPYLRERGFISCALNIEFRSEEEKWDCIGFIAAANPRFHATVYEGTSYEKFLEEYPDQPCYVDHSEALIRATNFRIEFRQNDLTIMPSRLYEERNTKSNAIFRTDFIRDLTLDYGFQFGNVQDFEKIEREIKNNGNYDLFKSSYDKYKAMYDQMKDISLDENLDTDDIEK